MAHDPVPDEMSDSSGSDPVPADEMVYELPEDHADAGDIIPAAPGASLPVVGLGGSAGGLEALIRFFRATAPKTGAAYVVVLHLAPERESALASILQRETAMPVHQVTENTVVKADHVYVISPGVHLSMVDGRLFVSKMDAPRGRRVAVDLFFRTLADTHGADATAIVLSGSDGDGAVGLKRVKERGGLTIAQTPAEADQDGMPRSAIATGMVDWVLPVDEMPRRLLEYRETARRLQLPAEEKPRVQEAQISAQLDEEALMAVLSYLRSRNGHDFSYYKRATILRRIARRMQVNNCSDLGAYLAYLRNHPGETTALLQDLLISVTNFFRDREAFAAVEAIIPSLFKDKGPNDQVRVWVAGCATGEEAYSFAILLSEYAARLEAPPQIQIFASDIDETAIETARVGCYPETIMADVSEERLRRFFSKESGRYCIRRPVREMVIFALHDLLKDSPFSRLDLVSCRNLMIYLNREAQARAFEIFHFALVQDGMLFLGSSESAEESTALFAPTDKKQRLYRRNASHRNGILSSAARLALSLHPPVPMLAKGGRDAGDTPGPGAGEWPATSVPEVQPRGGYWGDLHFRLGERLMPPSLVVNRNHDIVHLSESAGQFLQFGGGEPSMNVLRVVHPMLRIGLRAALFRAFKTGTPVDIERARFDSEGTSRQVDIAVHPGAGAASEYALVIFRPRQAEEAEARVEIKKIEPESLVRHLEEELDQIRSQWRETVEQYEASGEELKASNEELQAMNEELRAATEELETGREELQSMNEELTTVNQELKSKVDELSRANSDLQNLMASTNIATVFLDRQLCIKRYTPPTVALFNLIPTDVGRPLSDLTHRLEYAQIAADAERVLDRLAPVEREVRNAEGRWFLARMTPYRTMEDQIAGVVLTCVDITEQKHSTESMRWLSASVESSNDAIITFSPDGKIISWNEGAERIFGYTAQEMIGKPKSMLAPANLKHEVAQWLDQLGRGESIGPIETVRLRKDGGLVEISISVAAMRNESGDVVGATSIAQDISSRKEADHDLRMARDELAAQVEERSVEVRDRAEHLRGVAAHLTRSEQRERERIAGLLHDHLQQLLVSAKMRLEGLRRKSTDGEKDELETVLGLLDESLESSRTLTADLAPPILSEGLAPALAWLGEVWMKEKYGLQVRLELDREIEAAGEEVRILIFLAVRELLFNVVKHSQVLKARVKLMAKDEHTLRVIVLDHGKGFVPADLASAKSSGIGVGLVSVRQRLSLLGGSLELRSKEGEGVEAEILAPRAPAAAVPET
ncbi:chemotaxis protein CheB [Luteolibacter sp. Populi]|uniref:chemotaxis protein CheB n=1 Tax=Luteolibacter sp. Populi TaxID=3230487 RepID=UPI0034679720